MKKLFINLLFIVFFSFSFSFLFIWQLRDYTYQFTYDLFHQNKSVEDKEEVDVILEQLEMASLSTIEKNYRKTTWISSPEYTGMYQNAQFYLVSPKDIYQKIAGDTRIKDVVSRDEFYRLSILDRSKPIYWRIDKRILYKIIELRLALEATGHDRNGFTVRNGYRTPKHNQEIGGASKSRHIKGEAVDMIINDINKDGVYTNADKQIVLELLEEKIIGNLGGIGKYPGTRSVHMDVRGYRARWDSY